MKFTRYLKSIILTAAMAALASCNIFNLVPTPSDTGGNQQTSFNPSDIDKEDILPFSTRDMYLSLQQDVLPSKGDVRLLLLPIEFTDCPFEPQTLKDLEVATNGSAEQTGYWESVSSFYEKSSFGQSHLSYEIADVYKTGKTQRQVYEDSLIEGSYSDTDDAAGVIRDAYLNYLNKNGNTSTKKFDSDGNGWIDGVVAIYSGHNFMEMSETYDRTMFYWAYTYWTIGAYPDANWNKPNKNCPTPNLYIWMSYDFFYEAVNSPKVDAHTLIHETGHMYGLDDYYSNSSCMAGGHAMMDANVVDHDAYSKMMLGWIKPHIVTEPETITFLPSQETGDCILIPGENWNGTAYDEYFLLELYTPTGLNYLDSHKAYPGHQLAYNQAGIKLYHVDSRVMEITQTPLSQMEVYMKNPAEGMKQNTPTAAHGYMIAASNCYKQQWTAPDYDTRYSLLHMIEADNTFDFAYGNVGKNIDLFRGGSFTLKDFRKFFIERNIFDGSATMNKGTAFPYRIAFDAVGDAGATITVSAL